MEEGPHPVSKELILQAHMLSFNCPSPLPSLAWRTAWKGEGTVKTGQLAKGAKLLLKCSPDIKLPVFFRRSFSTGEIAPLYLSVLVSLLPNLLLFCVLLWSSVMAVLQIFVELAMLFWNLSVSGICPNVRMLLTWMLSPILDTGNEGLFVRGGQIPR